MKTSDKSNSINVNTGAQPSNNGRRKVLSYSVGLAASASLGGIGLLMPGVAQAEDISTTKTCSSLANEDGGNIPKLQLIYQSIPKSVEENCWAVNSVFRSNAVFYDSKARKAYAGVITQITRRDGWADPRTVTTRSWTLKSSASLLNINGEWTSNYYDEKGTRLLRLTKDELLNPLTHHKAWSHTKETSGSGHDEYRRRLADNPPTHTSWTAPQERTRLEAELKRLLVSYYRRMVVVDRIGSRLVALNRVERVEQLEVLHIDMAPTVGNEPPSYIRARIAPIGDDGWRYQMLTMVRDFNSPQVIRYRVVVFPEPGAFNHIENPEVTGDSFVRSIYEMVGAFRRYSMPSILQALDGWARLAIAATTSGSERAALYNADVELTRHGLNAPTVPGFTIAPFHLINAIMGYGSEPALGATVIPLSNDIVMLIGHMYSRLMTGDVLRQVQDAIDEEIRRAIPWLDFELHDEDAQNRRLIGYTQDKAYPGKPVIPPITGECRLCPSDNNLINDAW